MNKKGFTIIEVVLVLAIAGLIFLMVFLALPALQRSQRDTQRREDWAGFITQISNYQTNNRGKIPGGAVSTQSKDAWEEFINNYLRPTETYTLTSTGDTDSAPTYASGYEPIDFVDPDGQPYYIADINKDMSDTSQTLAGDKSLTWDDNKHQIYVYINATCDGENAVVSSGSRKVAIRAKFEGGGVYCGNN